MKPKYQFYATLLDKYQSYLSSSEIYQKYWGNSDNPEFTEEEFEKKQFQSLIDTINRVPFDSTPASQGTVFNEIVDCIILHKQPENMKVVRIEETVPNPNYNEDYDSYGRPMMRVVTGLNVTYKEETFYFPMSLIREFTDYFKGATPQVYTSAIMHTIYGDVLLYGYIDELMPTSVHDIKTSTRYSAGDFKNHFQHLVYPYCLNESGNDVSDFEYNIAVINRTKAGVDYSTFTEYYAYNKEIDVPIIRSCVENLIGFIEINRPLITDKKIFNL